MKIGNENSSGSVLLFIFSHNKLSDAKMLYLRNETNWRRKKIKNEGNKSNAQEKKLKVVKLWLDTKKIYNNMIVGDRGHVLVKKSNSNIMHTLIKGKWCSSTFVVDGMRWRKHFILQGK